MPRYERVIRMTKFYSMLMQFTQGTTPTRLHLVHTHNEDLVDEAIRMGYIIEIRKNEYGEPVYAITPLGKSVRDH